MAVGSVLMILPTCEIQSDSVALVRATGSTFTSMIGLVFNGVGLIVVANSNVYIVTNVGMAFIGAGYSPYAMGTMRQLCKRMSNPLTMAFGAPIGVGGMLYMILNRFFQSETAPSVVHQLFSPAVTEKFKDYGESRIGLPMSVMGAVLLLVAVIGLLWFFLRRCGFKDQYDKMAEHEELKDDPVSYYVAGTLIILFIATGCESMVGNFTAFYSLKTIEGMTVHLAADLPTIYLGLLALSRFLAALLLYKTDSSVVLFISMILINVGALLFVIPMNPTHSVIGGVVFAGLGIGPIILGIMIWLRDRFRITRFQTAIMTISMIIGKGLAELLVPLLIASSVPRSTWYMYIGGTTFMVVILVIMAISRREDEMLHAETLDQQQQKQQQQRQQEQQQKQQLQTGEKQQQQQQHQQQIQPQQVGSLFGPYHYRFYQRNK